MACKICGALNLGSRRGFSRLNFNISLLYDDSSCVHKRLLSLQRDFLALCLKHFAFMESLRTLGLQSFLDQSKLLCRRPLDRSRTGEMIACCSPFRTNLHDTRLPGN